jgi:thiamine-monophosphate kinase
MVHTISEENIRLSFIQQILSGSRSASINRFVYAGVECMDDAALVRISDTESLVIASDFIRGSGFYLFEMGHLDYYDIGYYLIVANLSDLAAMGARPFGLTTIFRYHRDVTDQQFRALFEGMKAAADAFDVEILGGDTGSYISNVFAATAFGLVKTEQALLRKSVHDGDLLCVTGVVGRPITALLYFKKAKPLGFELSSKEEERLLLSWRRPVARIAEGMLLSENNLAHACQDVSDGIKATVEQMSLSSGKTFSIYAERLPIDEATKKLGAYLGSDYLDIAVSASVDFELMFTISPEKQEECRRLFQAKGLPYNIIGEVNGLGRNVLINELGEERELPGVAWNHQSGDYLSRILKEKKEAP